MAKKRLFATPPVAFGVGSPFTLMGSMITYPIRESRAHEIRAELQRRRGKLETRA